MTELRNGSSGFAGSEPLAHAPAARRTNIFREELGKALSCSDDEEEFDIPELEQFDDAVGDTEDDEDEDE